ncbi:DUF4055 domain-containing protein [Tardiphaga sp.]|uniref:DUF4055 domain-containing protein n=1 Tax=Tardiphaga sp. TaxID=1926292 RepID=UPI00262C2246|nr:DUF4055 domain-containing protein [Tardiphaga sp.]MDB5620526.1 hypothetical protein [Tardiphaga sp.]
MADQDKGPDNPSSDHQAMSAYWEMIECINGGAETMRAAGEKYLPKFENETANDYAHRRKAAPFTNIYGDVSKNLASKPFSKEMKLKDGAAQSLVNLCEDIDGQGNNLHVFGATIFQYGLDKAVDWILVDYTKAPVTEKPRSIADEKAAGYRPYWVHISAERMIAVYSDVINGVETFIHARIREDVTERSAFDEVTRCRVRVLDRAKLADGSYKPATYQVYEKQVNAGGKVTWVSIEGPAPISIGVIPLVPFITGKRIGSTWRVRPPLRDIAHLQVEEYQQESNLKSVMELTCYPMLAGNGVNGSMPGDDGKAVAIRVPVGPRGVLFAPPDGNGQHGEWRFIEPSAESIKTLMEHLDATQKNMRDLGMQPMTTANLTVITTANVSVKAHSAVQAWALGLKDAFEQAFTFTVAWLADGSKEPEVEIFTDFGVDMEAGTELDALLKSQAQGILSKKTVQQEFQRRGVLSDNFSTDDEEEQLAEEEQGLSAEVAIDPVTGEVIEPSTRPKVLPNQPAVLPSNI